MTVGRIPNIEGGIQPTLLTTTGDIMYASSANNPARLGIGSSAQVLTVASGVPSWATPSSGSMTLLSTTTLSGASTTISGISGSYTNLFGIITGMTNATADGRPRIAINGSTNLWDGTNNGATGFGAVNAGYWVLIRSSTFLLSRTSADNQIVFNIFNYASTTDKKVCTSYGAAVLDQGTKDGVQTWGAYNSTSAVTSLVFDNSGGNLSTGTVLLYGVK